jgi:hypothetical protein
MTASSRPITSRVWRRRNRSGKQQPVAGVDPTSDCSSDHAVMARQVGPWLAKPRMSAAPRVRQSGGEPTSSFHQGQRHSRIQSPDVRKQSSPIKPKRTDHLANRGRPCTDIQGVLRGPVQSHIGAPPLCQTFALTNFGLPVPTNIICLRRTFLSKSARSVDGLAIAPWRGRPDPGDDAHTAPAPIGAPLVHPADRRPGQALRRG